MIKNRLQLQMVWQEKGLSELLIRLDTYEMVVQQEFSITL